MIYGIFVQYMKHKMQITQEVRNMNGSVKAVYVQRDKRATVVRPTKLTIFATIDVPWRKTEIMATFTVSDKFPHESRAYPYLWRYPNSHRTRITLFNMNLLFFQNIFLQLFNEAPRRKSAVDVGSLPSKAPLPSSTDLTSLKRFHKSLASELLLPYCKVFLYSCS